MTPEDHDQYQYVRGVEAGKRIERQNQIAYTVAGYCLTLAFGMAAGAVIIVMGL